MSLRHNIPNDVLYDQSSKRLSVIYENNNVVYFDGIEYVDEAPVVTKETLHTVLDGEIFTVYGVVDVSFRNGSSGTNLHCTDAKIIDRCPWLRNGRCTSIDRTGSFGVNRHEESFFLS